MQQVNTWTENLPESLLCSSPNSFSGTVTVPSAATASAETWSSVTPGAVRQRKSAPSEMECAAASHDACSTVWRPAVGSLEPSTELLWGFQPPAPSSYPPTATSCLTSPSNSSPTLISGARPTWPPSLTSTSTSMRRTYSSLAALSR